MRVDGREHSAFSAVMRARVTILTPINSEYSRAISINSPNKDVFIGYAAVAKPSRHNMTPKLIRVVLLHCIIYLYKILC